MASAFNDGGPAFPVPNDAAVNCMPGMSMRDWFAGQVLQGELAAQRPDTGVWDAGSEPQLARRCYVIADMMLKVREVARG